jgi:DNA-binding transcriptional MerR regulator
MDAYPYRMRDLVSRTRVSAPSVHFYGQQGLLPPARKTAGNQAQYSEATLSRLLWIRLLQNELRLPLRSIRWVLERWGELPIAEIRALQSLGRLLDGPDPLASREELAAIQQRLGPGDLDALVGLGLVRIQPGGTVSSQDLRILELCAAMRSAGLTAEAGFDINQLAVYRDAVEQLVTAELRRIVQPALDRHEPAALRDLVIRGLPLTNQLLSLLHGRAVQQETQRWLDLDSLDSARDTA